MRAVVTRAFSGAKDGEVMPREFAKGDIIEGQLAEAAIRFRDAKETEESKAEREAAEAGEVARLQAEQDEKERLADLSARKIEARTDFDKSTPEQVAEIAAHLKVDLTDITDRDAIFERLWAATVVRAEAAKADADAAKGNKK